MKLADWPYNLSKSFSTAAIAAAEQEQEEEQAAAQAVLSTKARADVVEYRIAFLAYGTVSNQKP